MQESCCRNLSNVLICLFYGKNEWIYDVKRALSLDFETGNRAQSKIKRLKGSSAYLGNIKTISRMSETNNVEIVIYVYKIS